jgi:hypothetical protein
MSSVFVPSSVITPENLGTVEVYGVMLSTATQSVCIGLKELNIPFIHMPALPNGPELANFSPFGTIPVMVHRPNGIYTTSDRDKVVLFELSAIGSYINELLNERGSNDPDHLSLYPKLDGEYSGKYAESVHARAATNQLCSVISHYIQIMVQDRYVKPFFALRNNGASTQDISIALADSLENAIAALMYTERIVKNTREVLKSPPGEYLLGDKPSWADVLLFPILRDFRATKPGVLTGNNERLPLLTSFLQKFEHRPSALSTFQGSFSASA